MEETVTHDIFFQVDITNYNILIDGKNERLQQGKERITQQGFLDYQKMDYFKDHYILIVVDHSKQKELDADSRAIQQIEFYGMLKTNLQVRTVLEKLKETMLEFYKGIAKVLWII